MVDEVEDLEAHRRKIAKEKDRAEAREMMDSFTEANKDTFAKEAFGDAFADILREVGRQQSYGSAGVACLARFFEMLNLGAKVSVRDLAADALGRIEPNWDDVHSDRERDLIRIAQSGLAFLLEFGARDGFASARRSKREAAFTSAIECYNERQAERLKAAQQHWARYKTVEKKTPAPRKGRPPKST